MGFYGNISSVNKSTFQFDKIYSNRKDMEDKATNDGVFIGRFVLVDYDNEMSPTQYVEMVSDSDDPARDLMIITGTSTKIVNGYLIKKQSVDENGIITVDVTNPIQITTGLVANQEDKENKLITIDDSLPERGRNIHNDTLVYILEEIIEKEEVLDINGTPTIIYDYTEHNPIPKEKQYLYAAIDGEFVLATPDMLPKAENGYLANHNIDADAYGGSIGRGWDSTVWQKTWKDGEIKYVMVAELNSVVPTFDIAVDRPTSTPVKPHWSTDSTNVYYKLHVQPSWGIRVKAKNDNFYSDGITKASDERGNYYYGARVGEESGIAHDLEESVEENRELAIYYHKAGFNRFAETPVDSNGLQDEIKFFPSGFSENRYIIGDDPANRDPFGRAVDTYEFSMMLPSIGSSISDMWNIMYGPGTIKDMNGNYLWDKTTQKFAEEVDPQDNSSGFKIRNTAIEWNTTEGRRAVTKVNDGLTYDVENLNSVAGIINSVHDLMGMNIRTVANTDNVDEWDTDKIYFIPENEEELDNPDAIGKYYYKKLIYTPSNLVSPKKVNVVDVKANGVDYYRKSFEEYDSYKNFYDTVNTSNEREIYKYNNYYKVTQDSDIDINAIYVKNIQTSTAPISADDRYNPSSGNLYYILPPSHKYYVQNATTYMLAEEQEPQSNMYFKIVWNSADDVYFYTRNKYYIGIKQFLTAEEKEGWMAAHLDGVDITEYDSFTLCVQPTLTAVKSTMGITNDKLDKIYYAFYKGVTVDPDHSKSVLVDQNMVSMSGIPMPEEKSLEDDLSEISGYYCITNGSDTKYYYKTVKNCMLIDEGKYPITEELQNVVVVPPVQEGGSSTISFKVSRYINEFDDSDNPALLTLMQWDNSETEEDKMSLIVSRKLVRDYTAIAYSISGATKVESDQISDVQDDFIDLWYISETAAADILDPKTVYQQATYTQWQQDPDRGYFIPEVEETLVYYSLEDGSYFIDDAGNYIRETAIMLNPEMLPEEKKDYFLINGATPLGENTYPFKEGTFYKRVPHETLVGQYKYILADTYESGVDYYLDTDLHVLADSNHNLNTNAVVSTYVESGNATGLTMGYASPEYVAEEIPDFAKYINSIHGLILETNRKLASGDTITRDTSTVQGSINKLNDIIHNFSDLIPGNLLMVDKIGRVHSGDWRSNQSVTAENHGFTSGGVTLSNITDKTQQTYSTTGQQKEADAERWINIYTDQGVANQNFAPRIHIEHVLNHQAAPTTTYSDKNLVSPTLPNGYDAAGLNQNTDDTLKLYTPIVDSMGHVIGKNTETVTLPYGFKTISTNGRSDLTVASGNTAAVTAQVDLVADSTQDILNIDSGNEWIKILTSENNDTISIYHDTKTTSTTIGEPVSLSNENSSTNFEIPVDSWDDTHHFASRVKTTYTLPNSYGKFTGDTGSSEASASHDTFSITGDTWVTTTVGTDSISLAHSAAHDAVTISMPAATSANAVEPQFGDTFILPDWTFDAKGHQKGISTHTVKIPQGSLTDASANGADVITQLAFTASSGALSTTRTNVGTLKLTGYNEAQSNPLIAASDTINGAIKKLENVLDNSSTSVNTRISNEITTFKGLVNDSESAGTVYGIVNKAKLDLTDYINAQISELTAPANPWGVQINIGADTNVASIDAGAAVSAGTKINLNNTGAIGYGSAYYDIDNGGIKIKTAGLYKIQGSAVFQLKANTLGKVWIAKKPANSNEITAISGAVESTGALPTNTTAAKITISLADTLVNLDVDDIIYLYGGATSTECSIKTNSLTYVLLELLSSASQQNTEPEEPENNGGGE